MSNKMTKEDSKRIQSTQAKGGGDMSSAGFAARAQSAGDRSGNQSAGGDGGAGATSSGAGGKPRQRLVEDKDRYRASAAVYRGGDDGGKESSSDKGKGKETAT